ncbi:hypothetical protein B0H11DRAFT_690320 [Mycena galericulata]|nr:hypothetical protein B0H11DRAFT_690320 [Mycena galericulata]
MLARLRPKCYNDIGNVMGHVPWLAFGAMIWTAHVAHYTFAEKDPPGPFWDFVSSCAAADAGFASDAKCAGIALHLFLPYLNVISSLWIGWVIYRQALAVHGSGEMKLPPEYVAAWWQGRAGELDQPVENSKMKEESSAV